LSSKNSHQSASIPPKTEQLKPDTDNNQNTPATKIIVGMTSENPNEEQNKAVVNESIPVAVIRVETPTVEKASGQKGQSNTNSNRDQIRNNVVSQIDKVSLQQNLK
jgi:hypothetical protein